jgi:hypothetical protein
MSLIRYHRPYVESVNVIDLVIQTQDGNEEYITVNEKTEGYYDTVDEINTSEILYYINDLPVVLPFNLKIGDTFMIDIERDTQWVESRVILSNSKRGLKNKAINFSYNGATFDDKTTNYDTEVYLYEVQDNASGNYNKVAENNNVESYVLDIDTGSGFATETLPFSLSTGDFVRLTIIKSVKDLPSNLMFSNSIQNTIVNVERTVFGWIPKCTQLYNGTDQYAQALFHSAQTMDKSNNESVHGWIYPTANATQVFIAAIETVDSQGWYIKLKSGTTGPTLQFQIFDDSGNSVDYNTVTELPLNKWTFFNVNKTSSNVVTIDLGDKDSKTLSSSVSMIDNSVGTLTGTTINTTDLLIGKDINDTKYFSGHFDNLHKISRQLTSFEVELLFNNGWAGYPMTLLRS